MNRLRLPFLLQQFQDLWIQTRSLSPMASEPINAFAASSDKRPRKKGASVVKTEVPSQGLHRDILKDVLGRMRIADHEPGGC